MNSDSGTLLIKHNAGFFSCCTGRLLNIINYFNENKKLPLVVDSTEQFKNYKDSIHINVTSISTSNKDITYEYFKHPDDANISNLIYTSKVNISTTLLQDQYKLQFTKYKNILCDNVSFFIAKYFSLSDRVRDIVDSLKNKYSISYDDVCGVYYRGTDIHEETHTGSWDEYILQAKKIKLDNQKIRFIVQSDEPGFINKFIEEFPDSIYISEIENSDKFIHSLYFFATIYIISQTKYIICSSSNVSLWFCFFRNSSTDIIQYLNQKSEMYTVPNELYIPGQIIHWF
jgi:hypothetical protein